MKRPSLKSYQESVEEWRPVVKYEGRYSVSNLGRVKTHLYSEKILKPQIDRWGYPRLNLWGVDGKQRNEKIHKLVAEAFIGEKPSPEIHVNHINGVKTDNRSENLEYLCHKENMAHAKKLGLVRKSKKCARR